VSAYRKKPVVVDAVEFRPDPEHPGDNLPAGVDYNGATDAREQHWSIRTLEGRMRVQPGDFVITGVKGERYPCKPDIFAATYQPAADAYQLHVEVSRDQLTQAELAASGEQVAQFFTFAHLPSHLAAVSRPFAELAAGVIASCPRNQQRTIALNKLLESKDAAVRALLAKP
jgi:hypothetical protein